MADEQKSITMYRNGEARQVDPKLYKVAVSKGWSRTQSATPSTSQPSPTSSGPAGGASGSAPQAGAMSRFGSGFASGVNPLHQTPEGMKPDSGGRGWDVAEDAFNLREAQKNWEEGNKAGAAGLFTGTAVQTMAPGLLAMGKGMGGAAKSSQIARASLRAVEIQKEVKGPIESARVAANYTQPIIDTLSSQYDKIHKALDSMSLAHNPQIVQKAQILKDAAEPAIRKLGEDILQKTRTIGGGAQTLMRYGDAHGLHTQIWRMMEKLDAYKIGQWEPQLKELDGMIEAGKSAVAKANGYGKEWESLGKLWEQANNLGRDIASRMSGPQGITGKILEKGGLQGMPEGATKTGKALAKASKVSGHLPKPSDKLAKGAATAGSAGGPMLRGLMSLMGGGQTDAPIGTQ